MSTWKWFGGQRSRKGWLVPFLTILVVGMGSQSSGAFTTDSGATTVTFNIAEAIEVASWPVSTLAMDPGVPGVPAVSGELRFLVKSNAQWGLQINSDTDGELREFDASIGTYVAGGHELGPLKWATSVDGPWTDLSSTPEVMYSEQPPTGEEGASVGFVVSVTPSFDNPRLPEGREYRIVLTYTAGVGF